MAEAKEQVSTLENRLKESELTSGKLMRENDDLKTTRKNYEAQIQQMTEEFVRMNEEIARLESQVEAAKASTPLESSEPPSEALHPEKEEKKKLNVAGSFMSGFNKLKKMATKETEAAPLPSAPAEDLFSSLQTAPSQDPSEDLFSGLSSTPQAENTDLFGGLSSTPNEPVEPAEEDLLNLDALATEDKKSRWGLSFGRKGGAPKEEKKKSGFGLGSLIKGIGGKSSDSFPPTEVGMEVRFN